MAIMRAALAGDVPDAADFVADLVFELVLLTSCVDRALDADDAEL